MISIMPMFNHSFMKLGLSSVIPYINEPFAKKLQDEVAIMIANIQGSQLNKKSKCFNQKLSEESSKMR